ncbi:MAG: DUF6677 family protein [Acidobacteriota bacterium]
MSSREESTDRVIKVEAGVTPAEQVRPGEAVPPSKMMLACTLAYCIPGLGHLVLGRWRRGLIFAVAIFTMFVLGLLMKGHLFYPTREDPLLIFHSFADVGIGLAYFVCYLLYAGFNIQIGFGAPQAAVATFEYGNAFLWTAGLLNYLVIMDAYDIAIGRKR